jgi:hypothetical protein
MGAEVPLPAADACRPSCLQRTHSCKTMCKVGPRQSGHSMQRHPDVCASDTHELELAALASFILMYADMQQQQLT